MMRRVAAVLALVLVTGCILPNIAMSDGAAADAEVAGLVPGAVYVSTYPLDERTAVCLYLNYAEGSREFYNCLQGYFPSNPAFQKRSG